MYVLFGYGTGKDIEHPESLPSLELVQDGSTIAITIIARKQPLGSDLECHVLLDLNLLSEGSRLMALPAAADAD